MRDPHNKFHRAFFLIDPSNNLVAFKYYRRQGTLYLTAPVLPGFFCWPFPFAILHAMETGQWGRDFWRFLLPRRATRSDLTLSDPMPLVMEFLYTLRRFSTSGFKTMRGSQDWSQFVTGDSGRDSTQ